MKNITLIIFCFINFYLSSQNKKITIVDSITKKHIEYVNIKYLDSKKGTFSDSLGAFDINKKASKKILISILGYKNKILFTQKIKDTISLSQKTIVLDEISININSKKDYGFHLEKSKFIGSSIKRAIVAIYIKNEKANIESYISSLHFKIKKRNNSISIIRPHLYTVNPETKIPEKELLEHNILIKKQKKGKEILSIDISDKNIFFPKEGVFVALEWVGNTEDIDFGYSEVKENPIFTTFLTSLNFKKKIWTPLVLPKNNKSIFANFGITTIETEN